MTEKICPLSEEEKTCGAWCKWAVPEFEPEGKKCVGYECELLIVFESILNALLRKFSSKTAYVNIERKPKA